MSEDRKGGCLVRLLKLAGLLIVVAVVVSVLSSDEEEATSDEKRKAPPEQTIVSKPPPPTGEAESAVRAKPSSTPSREVTRAKLGDDWPFTVEQGEVDCISGGAVFRSGGKTYRLRGHPSISKLPAIDPIWKENPEIPGAKISVGPVIDMALKHCE